MSCPAGTNSGALIKDSKESKMKTLATVLFLTASLLSFPSLAAEKSKHNPTGSDEVEQGWRSGGCGSRKGCGDDSSSKVEKSTKPETTEDYGKKWLERELQGEKPRIRTW
jgi:hypothetical protein